MNVGAIRSFVDEIEPARRFYENVLGLALPYDGTAHGLCVFRSGSVELIVEAIAHDAPAEDRGLVGRLMGVSFDVADIRAERERLAALGVVFSSEPALQPWGGCLATLRDPAGNELMSSTAGAKECG